MADHSCPKHRFTIFAITASTKDGGNPLAFVEKTRQNDLRDVLRYHRNHNGVASPIFKEGHNIHIHYLDTVQGSVSDTLPYIHAYIRFFFEHAYDVICHHALYEAALDLNKRAQTIYDQIACKSADSVISLQHPHSKLVSVGKNTVFKKESLTSRLSIRLSKNEHLLYRAYCKKRHVTQRDALLMLLAQSDGLDTASAKRIQEQANIIDQQRQHIRHLDSLIQRGPQGAKADKRILDSLHLCKSGLQIYFQHLFDNCALPNAIPCTTWNRFKSVCCNWNEYQYPTDSTPFLFQLDYMCYGKGTNACIFLFGKDPYTEQKLRIRFYNKREYIGPHPASSPYFHQNACFLIICRRDDSGAADMLLGLPIPSNTSQAEVPDNSNAPTALNDLLLDATNRSRQSDMW